MKKRAAKWDDERSYRVLLRQSAEDLHAGVYDSYTESLRARRDNIDPSKIGAQALRIQQEQIRMALNNESPLVPYLGNGAVSRELILYRVHPSSGLMIKSSGVIVAYCESAGGGEMQPIKPFSSEQTALQLDHLENLANNNLYPEFESF